MLLEQYWSIFRFHDIYSQTEFIVAVKCLCIFSLLLLWANCYRRKRTKKKYVVVYGIIIHLYILYRLLLVGGCETDEDGVSKAAGCGISAWRILSGSPHYKQVTNYEDDVRTVSMCPHLLDEYYHWKLNRYLFMKDEYNVTFCHFLSYNVYV